jgi:hypothetical protein
MQHEAHLTIHCTESNLKEQGIHYYTHGFSSHREALKPGSEVLCSCEDLMDEICFKVDGINRTCDKNQRIVLKIDLAAPN